jgi:hypothetical protein
MRLSAAEGALTGRQIIASGETGSTTGYDPARLQRCEKKHPQNPVRSGKLKLENWKLFI